MEVAKGKVWYSKSVLAKCEEDKIQCEACGCAPAKHRFQHKFICDGCLNPKPSDLYYEEQVHYWTELRSSMQMIARNF